MNNELKRKLGLKLVESGMVKNCYDPNWAFLIDEIIDLCQPQWISVKDRLPESNKLVIVSGGIARYNGMYWFSETSQADRRIEWEVTHWQPLPEPPEES